MNKIIKYNILFVFHLASFTIYKNIVCMYLWKWRQTDEKKFLKTDRRVNYRRLYNNKIIKIYKKKEKKNYKRTV